LVAGLFRNLHRHRPGGTSDGYPIRGGDFRWPPVGAFQPEVDLSWPPVDTFSWPRTWIDPKAGKTTLDEYAERWLEQRNELAFRTREHYGYLLELHVLPTLGRTALINLAPSTIRSWHASLAQMHPSTAAKAYRLLSAILRTAVVDGFLVSSSCKVDGAGIERPAERPVATVAEVGALETAMPEHLRLIVDLATWCQLRRVELLGLRRKDVDLDRASIHVEQSRTVMMRPAHNCGPGVLNSEDTQSPGAIRRPRTRRSRLHGNHWSASHCQRVAGGLAKGASEGEPE
jgi:integrase